MQLAEKISNAELAVMKILWREEKPVSFSDLRVELQRTMCWEKSTINTLIRRLVNKGCLLYTSIKAADWQSKLMHHMIENHGVEVIFSHMHNIDLQGHNYMKYLKNRDTSRYDESEVVKFAEATYKVTDDYIGSFMHLIDEGWTIIVFSDHALISAEEEAVAFGDNSGVSIEPLRSLGYTVLKVDENGKELPEVDWTKSKAIMTRSNSIYINVKAVSYTHLDVYKRQVFS